MIAYKQHIRQHRCCGPSCMRVNVESFGFSVQLGWLYMGTTTPPVDPCCGRWVHAWHIEGEAGPSREPGREEETVPMWTYAFCVLQTFHRLCKTSESVRPLEMWEEGKEGGRGEGTGKLTGQFSRITAVYLPSPPETPKSISKRGPAVAFVQLIPLSVTHDVNMLKNHELGFKWHHLDIKQERLFSFFHLHFLFFL